MPSCQPPSALTTATAFAAVGVIGQHLVGGLAADVDAAVGHGRGAVTHRGPAHRCLPERLAGLGVEGHEDPGSLLPRRSWWVQKTLPWRGHAVVAVGPLVVVRPASPRARWKSSLPLAASRAYRLLRRPWAYTTPSATAMGPWTEMWVGYAHRVFLFEVEPHGRGGLRRSRPAWPRTRRRRRPTGEPVRNDRRAVAPGERVLRG